ncbi:MAG TPA: LLM class flavin-dependent oxidoreductase [Candidatus Binatia bacterium]
MAADGLKFGVAAPQIHTRLPVDVEEIQRYLKRAEELGFDSLWVQEQAVLRQAASALEGITMLGYAAAVTRRVRLGMAVFLITLRNPIHLAKSIASLDQLSQGRFLCGVGLGAVTRLYQAYGLSPEKRLARFNEALTLMQKLWTEDNVTFEGQFWQLKNATLVPKPFQKPHPPVWFGGSSPAAVRRAALRGSGFIGAGSSSTESFAEQVKILYQTLAEANKDPADFTIAKRVYIAVDRDRDRAAARLREWFGLYYGAPDMAEKVSVWGGPEECAEKVGAIAGAGARLLVLNPVYDLRDQMEALAGEVIPRLAGK